MDNVKKHEYVMDNDEARPIIMKALSFLYELDEIGKREIEVEKSFFNFFSFCDQPNVNLEHISLYVLLTDSHTIDCNSKDTTRYNVYNGRMAPYLTGIKSTVIRFS